MDWIINFIKDILLPVIAIVISVIALVKSANANKISEGQIELNISTLIKETEYRTMDLAIAMSKYFGGNLSETEEKELQFLQTAYDQAIESNLNAYEEACAKYLDGKTDKERFKRMYNIPIRRLLDEPSLKKYFPAHNCSFKCILKVHDEWFNLEK